MKESEDWMDYVHPLPVHGAGTAKATCAPLPESKWDEFDMEPDNTLTEQDAEKLEKVGFVNRGVHVQTPLGTVYHKWVIYSLIDDALIGVLVGMAQEKAKIEFHKGLVSIEPWVIGGGRTVVSGPRQIFDALIEVLEATDEGE